MKFWRWILCCVLMCAPVAAQAASPVPVDIQQFKGRIVFLWGMEGGDRLSFDAQGQEIGSYEKVPFAYSAVKIEGVHRSGTAVEFKGRRVALVFPTPSLPLSTKDLRFVPLKETVTIRIAVNASDPRELKGALNQVFALTAAGALAGRSPEQQQLDLNTIGSTTHTDADQPKNVVKGLEISELIQTQNGGKVAKLTPLGRSGGAILVNPLGPQSSADGQNSEPILISALVPTSPMTPDERVSLAFASLARSWIRADIQLTSGWRIQ